MRKRKDKRKSLCIFTAALFGKSDGDGGEERVRSGGGAGDERGSDHGVQYDPLL